jgi:hypothetical protein
LALAAVNIETPDLWDQLRRQTEILAGTSDAALENTPFTSDERNEIANQIYEVREFTKSKYIPSDLQLTDLNSKLAYLIGAASRPGRKDWLNARIGAIFGLFLVTALPPDALHHIFQMLLSGIARLIGHGVHGLGGA